MGTNPLARAALPALLLACGATAAPSDARAQSQTPALGCYVDTPAFDVPTEGACTGLAPPQKTIVFEVMYRQTPYTRYSYAWSGCASNTYYCFIQNAGSGTGEKTYSVAVVITDHQTGASYTRAATATLSRP